MFRNKLCKIIEERKKQFSSKRIIDILLVCIDTLISLLFKDKITICSYNIYALNFHSIKFTKVITRILFILHNIVQESLPPTWKAVKKITTKNDIIFWTKSHHLLFPRYQYLYYLLTVKKWRWRAKLFHLLFLTQL